MTFLTLESPYPKLSIYDEAAGIAKTARTTTLTSTMMRWGHMHVCSIVRRGIEASASTFTVDVATNRRGSATPVGDANSPCAEPKMISSSDTTTAHERMKKWVDLHPILFMPSQKVLPKAGSLCPMSFGQKKLFVPAGMLFEQQHILLEKLGSGFL